MSCCNEESAVTERHLNSIDGLKGIGACIIAFAWHYQHFQPQNGSPFERILTVSYQHGWTMVDLFFLISGFCMMGAYGMKVFHYEISFKDYIFRRIRKLYPLFLLTTGIVIILQIIHHALSGGYFVYENFDLYHLVLNILFLQNGLFETGWSYNAPSWCISICILLYALLWLICSKVKKTSSIYCTFALLWTIGGMLILSGWNYPVLNRLIGRGLIGFSSGVILYGIQTELIKRHARTAGYICLVFLALVYILLRFFPVYAGNIQMLFILGIAPAILISALNVSWLGKALGWKPLAYIGKVSIGIYLLHFPVQLLLHTADLLFHISFDYSSKKFWLLYVGVTFLTASVYYMIQIKQQRQKS